MSIVNRLQNIVKKRGTTFKQLERDTGLGNGTIRRWEEQSPRLDKLMKVADYLQVSLDYLVYGRDTAELSDSDVPEFNLESIKKTQQATHDIDSLTNLETDLILMFRLLPKNEQADIFDILHFKCGRNLNFTYKSPYWRYFDEIDGQKASSIVGDGTKSEEP